MAASEPEFERWLVRSMRSGLVAVDEAGAIRMWNGEAERILGGPATRAPLGRPCREVLAQAPVLASLLVEALQGHQPPSRAEILVPVRSGESPRTLGFTLATVRDEAKRVRGAAILFRDLTPVERRQVQDRLKERLAALGQMAAGLAHEMRNPLAGMEMLAGLLHRRLVRQPEERELVEDLVRELRRVGRAVDQSLEFVRPENPTRTETDVGKLLDEAVAQARSRVGFTGPIHRHDANDIPLLPLDRQALLGVLAGVIENAFEAMAAPEQASPPRLEIGVRLDPPGGGERGAAPAMEGSGACAPEPRQLVIWIEDNGPGVPDELRERIFYPFFSTKPKGSGVGLALAQKTVLSHGGRIELETPADGGTRFLLHLPLALARPPGRFA